MTRVHGAPPDPGTGPRRSLVLAGGGMRVAYQAGVLRALLDAGLTFHHVDGASGGTINLAMLLSGQSPDEMAERWRTLDPRGFASLLPPAEYLHGTEVMSLGDADGIVGKVFPHLGIDPDRIRSAEGIQGTFNLCDFATKTNVVVPHQEIDLELLVAGISLPILLPPVRRGDHLYVDPVWVKDANLMEAVRQGAEEIWLAWCIGNTPEYRPGIFDQYVHMIEISANAGLFEELAQIRSLNERIEAGEAPGGRTTPVRLHVIRPEYPLPLDPDYYFGRVDGATLVATGYRDAKRYLSAMRPGGVPLGPEVTRMRVPGPGVTFRETMTGPFALGVTDPVQGQERGTEQRSSMTLHVSVEIPDAERFMADPAHRGSIVGHVEITGPDGFGGMIPAKTGTFNLFSPGDGGGRLMVYELGFEHWGREWYVAGSKEVRDDPGFDLWSDTTTLYCRLYEGSGTEGPVAGAGVLRIDMGGLGKMLSTLRTVAAGPVRDRAKLLARFGAFFVGSLWDVYTG